MSRVERSGGPQQAPHHDAWIALRPALVILLAALSSFAASPVPPPPPALPPEARAAAFLDETWRASGHPGISAAVALKGRIVFSRGVGFADLDNLVPATASTVYNIGSVSKVNAAIAVMQLVEQGKVRLDDPIRRYVPAFPDKGTPITVQQIMTHTSGIRHYRPDDFADSGGDENMKSVRSLEDGLRFFKDDPLLFKPGAFYSYSSYAVNLLQGVVEKAGGRPFEDYLRENVWGPAGMLATAFDIPERIVPHRARSYRIDGGRVRNSAYGDLTYKFAGGGMISTVEDLARLGVALNHGQLMKPETRALMLRPHLDPVMRFQEKGPPEEQPFQQGLIWRIRRDAAGRTAIDHSGSVKGFWGFLLDYPGQDLVVAILSNANENLNRDHAVTIAQFFLAGPPEEK